MGWTRRVAVGVLVAVGLAGCSNSPELPERPAAMCDGGRSPATTDEALRTLLEAASRADAALACTATTGTPEGMDLGTELVRLEGVLRERGITVETVRMEKLGGDWSFSLYSVTGSSGTRLEPLEFKFVRQKDSGYRVLFPLPDKGFV